MGKLFALVDCNNFYASCERVFEPALRGRPVVVLSNNDGCVIARSNEAKALGIAMGAPWHLHRKAFARHGVVVRSSNYALYGDLSRRVMEVLAAFAPAIEIYSIDEAFIDLTGVADPLPQLAALRGQVLRWTGIPISIGVAPTKTLAKVANKIAKTGKGVHALTDPAGQRAALSGLALREVWGISSRFAERLAALGITDAAGLLYADTAILRKHMGVVVERLALELRGIACHGLEVASRPRKSIACTRSFGRPVTTSIMMAEAVSTYTERACEKLRRQDLACNAVLVFIHTNPFKPHERPYSASQVVTLPTGSADTGKLIQAALRGLRAIWRPGFAYKKAGVVLLDLAPADRTQLDLFSTADSARRRTLMRTVDRINARLGRGTVTMASSGVARPWGVRSDLRSKRYTTAWGDLLQVGEPRMARRDGRER